MHIFFLIKKTKHICFIDTNNVTYINSYLFERHKKYGVIITIFVIEYNKYLTSPIQIFKFLSILILFMSLFEPP